MQTIANTDAKKHDIPIAFHLDHHESLGAIEPALQLGVKSVMIDGSMKSFEENIALTKEVVERAHAFDATVEAELDRIAGQEDNIQVSEEDYAYTNHDEADQIAAETSVN